MQVTANVGHYDGVIEIKFLFDYFNFAQWKNIQKYVSMDNKRK